MHIIFFMGIYWDFSRILACFKDIPIRDGWRWRAERRERWKTWYNLSTWIKKFALNYTVISCWLGDFVQIWTLLRKLIFFSSPFLSSSFSCIMEMIFLLFLSSLSLSEIFIQLKSFRRKIEFWLSKQKRKGKNIFYRQIKPK